MSDEVQDAIAAVDHWARADQDAVEEAFGAGRRERSAAHGRIIWTTAPRDYDTNDATELEVVGDYFGKPLRKIAIDPEGYRYQTNRYASGTYGVWDKDPIEEDRAAREKYARQDAERAAVEAKRQAGVAWLRSATTAELADEDLCWGHGARYDDIRAEKRRRHEETAETRRATGMARLKELVPDGVTLIDAGAYIPPLMAGMHAVHRPANVYFDVKLIHGWPDDVEHAKFEHGVGRAGGVIPAERVMDLMTKGQLRHAKVGEVPPGPVVNRIGVDRWKEIRRVEVGGRVVWVGRATFGSQDLVLDEQGRLVRNRKLVEAAEAAARRRLSGDRRHGDSKLADKCRKRSSPR
jgi:hypothetical protein